MNSTSRNNTLQSALNKFSLKQKDGIQQRKKNDE